MGVVFSNLMKTYLGASKDSYHLLISGTLVTATGMAPASLNSRTHSASSDARICFLDAIPRVWSMSLTAWDSLAVKGTPGNH